MSWQIPLIAGVIGGVGIALLIAELVPRRPRLASALMRLGEPEILVEVEQADLKTRIGTWGVRHLSERPGFKVPESDLRVLGQSPVNFFYMKIITLVLLAVTVPAGFTVISILMGLPPMVPVMTLILIVPLGMFAIVLADSTVTSKAKEAREEVFSSTGYISRARRPRAASRGHYLCRPRRSRRSGRGVGVLNDRILASPSQDRRHTALGCARVALRQPRSA